jgi:hypothetical protein
MINVNKITALLAQLPDSALQQYAAMHKEDPYTLALSIEESNRRKMLRQSVAQTAQTGTVVDRAIQQMAPAKLPEESGIAMLPTRNMESIGAAAGGIVAFSAGDQVRDPYAYRFDMTPEAREAAFEEYKRELALRPEFPGSLMEAEGFFIPAEYPTSSVDKLTDKKSDTSAEGKQPPKDTKAAPEGGQGGAGVVDLIRGAGSVGVESIPSFDALGNYRKMLAAVKRDPDTAAIDEMYGKRVKEIEGIEEERRRQLSELGPVAAGLEAALNKREKEALGKEEKNLNFALIEAGLGMMAGTSRSALANIAMGGSKGLASYKEGLKDLEKAKEAREEMMARIEEARRAEARGDITAATQAKQAAAGLRFEGAKAQEDARERIFGQAVQIATSLTKVQGDTAQSRLAAMASMSRDRASQLNDRVKIINSQLSTQRSNLEYIKSLINKNPGVSTKEKEEKQMLQREADKIMGEINGLNSELQSLKPATVSGFTVTQVPSGAAPAGR